METAQEVQSIAALLRSDSRYKYLDTFITLFVVVLLISNIVAAKFFALGPLRISCAQMLFPITYIFGDIFTEVYGYSASRRAIWYGFFAEFILVVITYIAVKIPPAPEFTMQVAFTTVFSPVGRIVAASLIAYWCGEFANSFTLAKLKLLTKGRHLWTRTIGSTVVGQAVDTAIVVSIIFYDKPLGTILNLILSGYLIKVVYETLMTPFTYLVVNTLKRAENADYFDHSTNFNPFATRGRRVETPPRRSASSFTWLGKYLSLALTLPACVVAGYFIGNAFDQWLHTGLGKVIGIFLGMTGGLIQILRELTRDSHKS